MQGRLESWCRNARRGILPGMERHAGRMGNITSRDAVSQVSPGRRCTCIMCGRSWVSLTEHLPERCQNSGCGSGEWNGRKLPTHGNEIVLSPRKRGRPKIATYDSDD
jgi:hypothetical protein